MVEPSQENLQAAGVEEKIGAIDADTGYFSEENVSYLEGEQIDPHIATERLKHHEKIPLAPQGRIPKNGSSAESVGERTAPGALPQTPGFSEAWAPVSDERRKRPRDPG